jgi:hypothetical protein
MRFHPELACHPHAAPREDVARREGVRGRVDGHALLRHEAAAPGHREVHPVGDSVGEVEDLERRPVRHDRTGCLAEPSRDDLVAGLGRVVPEPLEAPADAHEPAGPRVVAEQR